MNCQTQQAKVGESEGALNLSGGGFEDAGFPRDFILPGHSTSLATQIDPDAAIRAAAFQHVRELVEIYGKIPAAQLRAGMRFGDEQVALTTRARGIFKPKQMNTLLSINTPVPRPGRQARYRDQGSVLEQFSRGVESVQYSFMGQNSEAGPNRLLRDARDRRLPIIYFLGIEPALYIAILPVFIADWDPSTLTVKLEFSVPGDSVGGPPTSALERRYGLSLTKYRIHQDAFRGALLEAYECRCALSGLPEPVLLDAAHIMADRDEKLGQPIIQNGLLLSKIHHAAFDKHLIGIDEDYRIHVADRLKRKEDGPILEALKDLNGQTIRFPKRPQDYPDPARLARRFMEFKATS